MKADTIIEVLKLLDIEEVQLVVNNPKEYCYHDKSLTIETAGFKRTVRIKLPRRSIITIQFDKDDNIVNIKK